METYTVKAGDTLFAIAKKFGVTVRAILDANPEIPPPGDDIDVGQVIQIPVEGQKPTPIGSSALGVMIAVVTSAGSLQRGSDGEIKTARVAPNTGEYTVQFPTDVDQWAWFATLAPIADQAQSPGIITVELENMSVADTVHVRTYNFVAAARVPADRPFHLQVQGPLS